MWINPANKKEVEILTSFLNSLNTNHSQINNFIFVPSATPVQTTLATPDKRRC